MAPAAALAPQRRALHPVRAPGAAARLQESHRVSQAGARRARADRAVPLDVSPTRRELIAGAAVGALGLAGVYELVDHLAASPPKRPVAAAPELPEQHLLQGDQGREPERRRGARAAAPPRGDDGQARPRAGRPRRTRRRTLEDVAREARRRLPVDARRARRDGRLGAPVLPPPRPRPRLRRSLPFDRRAGKAALLDARPVPERPRRARCSRRTTSRSCSAPTSAPTSTTRSTGSAPSGLLKVTSLRRGFAGGSLDGGVSLPRTMALAANVPGADLIPEGAELFLGFTSTQKAAFGPGKIANFETLGYVDLRDSGYFREGTHMHLSHVAEDLEAWYVNFAFDERVTTAFRPGLDVPEGTQVVPMGPEQASDTQPGAPPVPPDRADRPQRVDPDDVAPPADVDRPRRDALPEGHRDPDPRRLQHARQPVLLLLRAERDPGGADGRDPLHRLQPLERRLRPQPARDGRRAPERQPAASSRTIARRGSTRCSAPLTARTSSCRRGGTAASRSPSAERGGARIRRGFSRADPRDARSRLSGLGRRGRPSSSTVRIVLGGDVMLGRGVARLAARDPDAVFAGIRLELGSADLAVANLESPLTNRPHRASHGPNALEARPATARILAAAGFDAMAIANNHAGDAGPATVPDTMRALRTRRARRDRRRQHRRGRLHAADRPCARADDRLPLLRRHRRGATRGLGDPGCRLVERPAGARAPSRAPARRPTSSSSASTAARTTTRRPTHGCFTSGVCSRAGAPTSSGARDRTSSSRPSSSPAGTAATTVVATSLGNLVFDQSIPGTRTGELLEVLAGKGGVRAFRLGATAQAAVERGRVLALAHAARERGRARAASGGGSRRVPALAPRDPRRRSPVFPARSSTRRSATPRATADSQLAVSFWRPYRRTDVNALIPRARLVDRRGLTAHVGLYRARDRGASSGSRGRCSQPVSRLARLRRVARGRLHDAERQDDGLDRRLAVARLRLLAAARARRPRPAGLRRRRR